MLVNVQGLVLKTVNKLQSNEVIDIFKQNDIVLFTETWLSEEADVQVKGFQNFKLNRTLKKRGSKRNAGGIIAYVRNELVTDRTLFMQDCDDILWLRLDGGLFNLAHDLYLCVCYNVPEGSSRQGLLDSIDLFDRLSDHMVKIKNESDDNCVFLLCGDFNARSAELPDYVEQDTAEHIDILPDDYSTDTPLKRVSEDKGFNRYGSHLLDFCKQTGMRILNGRVGKDSKIGKCTYVGSNGKSLVDYAIASQSLFSLIDKFEVAEPNIFSDHCVINFSLSASKEVKVVEKQHDPESLLKYKYVWNNEHAEAYREVLDSDCVRMQIESLKTDLSNTESLNELNANLNSFQNLMESVCSPLFKKNIIHGDKMSSFNEYKQPWYTDECKFYRNVFYRNLDSYRSNKEDQVFRENMVKARSDYKRVLRKSRYHHKKLKTEKSRKGPF